jgi:hypothetical protein
LGAIGHDPEIITKADLGRNSNRPALARAAALLSGLWRFSNTVASGACGNWPSLCPERLAHSVLKEIELQGDFVEFAVNGLDFTNKLIQVRARNQ